MSEDMVTKQWQIRMERVMKKFKEKKTTEDARHPRLRYSLTISNAGIKIFTSGKINISVDEMRGMAKGEIVNFVSWEEFSNLPAREIADYAVRFKVNLPPATGKTESSLLVWAEMCRLGRPSYQLVQSKSGKKHGRVYRRVLEITDRERADRDAITLCPQAQACLDIFNSAGLDEIPESRLMEMMNEQAETLKTRQNPWRIFQYYRPQLIKARWITLN